MNALPRPKALIDQSMAGCSLEAQEAGWLALAALTCALANQPTAAKSYLQQLHVDDRVELDATLRRLKEHLADVGLEERSVRYPD